MFPKQYEEQLDAIDYLIQVFETLDIIGDQWMTWGSYYDGAFGFQYADGPRVSLFMKDLYVSGHR